MAIIVRVHIILLQIQGERERVQRATAADLIEIEEEPSGVGGDPGIIYTILFKTVIIHEQRAREKERGIEEGVNRFSRFLSARANVNRNYTTETAARSYYYPIR